MTQWGEGVIESIQIDPVTGTILVVVVIAGVAFGMNPAYLLPVI
jgi:hypothetical protein